MTKKILVSNAKKISSWIEQMAKKDIEMLKEANNIFELRMAENDDKVSVIMSETLTLENEKNKNLKLIEKLEKIFGGIENE